MDNGKPTTIVIFGASGDLTKRKLVPALFELANEGLLPKQTKIVGFARREKSHEQFRNEMQDGILQFARSKPQAGAKALADFLPGLYYHAGTYDDQESYAGLGRLLQELDGKNGGPANNRLFYLSTPPTLFFPIIARLGDAELIANVYDEEIWTRVIIEKPFGRDLESARKLNRDILSVLDESQVYRIDHYLGKETVQNIMAFRFGNSIFEPLWNRRYIDHVQITVGEAVSVGSRAGYYDRSGAVRDMVQNHILQLVALVGMEPPASFAGNAVRDEKVKVLSALRPIDANQIDQFAVRGQYTAGKIGDEFVPDYLHESGVNADSKTETYAALKLHLDNWRWSGVPFYVRSGKALAKRITEITIQFRQPPLVLFGHGDHEGHVEGDHMQPNRLSLRVQPNESIRLQFGLKVPGSRMMLQPNEMEFCYSDVFHTEPPEAYERLILDAILGETTLFIRDDEVDAAWRYVDTILNAWQEDTSTPPSIYGAGSWGPEAVDNLLAKDGRKWATL